ncbi:GNAT family N-acetyltransferase [Salimicrobium halophilum]|uniref:Acetyltransferase (GNAT) family protein n=1 Tax=Salimicrobium halophilum TaxID=86666 RepID=A0A1G8R724_9BACI|nr:GNAT family N-acetyltransferase [Salimicrobium halophilum]SDJ12761.1 Acetyltransferase (GNAT) family protein [Salimicrobium halophilum]
MKIRNVTSEDYYILSPLINEWWGGRQMSEILPKLFFDHFNTSSFIAEEDGAIFGFLIGFMSQSKKEEAYIHFAGVHPDHRQKKVGKKLYEEFFRVASENERSTVKAVTSPVNKTSIAYHSKIGFSIKDGDKSVDGIIVTQDYDGPRKDRVLFEKRITK